MPNSNSNSNSTSPTAQLAPRAPSLSTSASTASPSHPPPGGSPQPAASIRRPRYRRGALARLSKLGIAEEEADETCFWMELLAEGGLVPERRLQQLKSEGEQLTAILVASRKTGRGNA